MTPVKNNIQLQITIGKKEANFNYYRGIYRGSTRSDTTGCFIYWNIHAVLVYKQPSDWATSLRPQIFNSGCLCWLLRF